VAVFDSSDLGKHQLVLMVHQALWMALAGEEVRLVGIASVSEANRAFGPLCAEQSAMHERFHRRGLRESRESKVANRGHRPADRNHNIWNNNGTWWAHFTIHKADYTKERVRVSLGTSDELKARMRRDHLLGRPGEARKGMREFWVITPDEPLAG
jgi:hypothetical protein